MSGEDNRHAQIPGRLFTEQELRNLLPKVNREPSLQEASRLFGVSSQFTLTEISRIHRQLNLQIRADLSPSLADHSDQHILKLREEAATFVNMSYQVLKDELNRREKNGQGAAVEEDSRASEDALSPDELLAKHKAVVLQHPDSEENRHRVGKFEILFHQAETIDDILGILQATTNKHEFWIIDFTTDSRYQFPTLIQSIEHVLKKASEIDGSSDAVTKLTDYIKQRIPRAYRMQMLLLTSVAKLEKVAAASREVIQQQAEEVKQLLHELTVFPLTVARLRSVLKQLQTHFADDEVSLPKGEGVTTLLNKHEKISLKNILETIEWLDVEINRYPGPIYNSVGLLMTLSQLVSRLPNKPYVIDIALAIDAIDRCRQKKGKLEFGPDLIKLRGMEGSVDQNLAYLGKRFKEYGITF